MGRIGALRIAANREFGSPWAATGTHARLPSLDCLQAAQLDDRGFRAYLHYLQTGLFASFSPPPELETFHQLFRRLALPPGGEDGNGEGAAGGAAQQQHHQQQQVQQREQEVDQPPAAGAQQQEQQVVQQGPRTSYTFYGGTQGKALRKQLFHPEYVALLAACSPLVWLLPEGLHEVRSATVHARRCSLCPA